MLIFESIPVNFGFELSKNPNTRNSQDSHNQGLLLKTLSVLQYILCALYNTYL